MTSLHDFPTASRDDIARLINAVLYEGCVLFPYRAPLTGEEDGRFLFAGVSPKTRGGSSTHEQCFVQTECLLQCPVDSPTLWLSVRFLHPMWQEIGLLPAPLPELPQLMEPAFQIIPQLFMGGQLHRSGREAVERQANISLLPLDWSWPRLLTFPFFFPELRALEPIRNDDGKVAGIVLRRQEALEGIVELAIQPIEAHCFKITVRIVNHSLLTPLQMTEQDAIIMRTFVAPHVILHAGHGEFISMADVTAEHKHLIRACKNSGLWPVLVGDEGVCDTLLSSPVILPDYPKITDDFGVLHSMNVTDDPLTPSDNRELVVATEMAL